MGRDETRGMFNQQQATHAPQNVNVPWWVRFCRWLWKHPLPFLLWTLLINVAINIISSWLIAPSGTNALPVTSNAAGIAQWVSTHWLLSISLSTGSLLMLLLTWQGRRFPRPVPVAPELIQMAVADREHMLGRLRFSYKQLREQSLQEAVAIELRLTSRFDAERNAAGHSPHPSKQSAHALADPPSIIEAYNQAQRELLILGQPGAGKSTLLLELALYLIEQAEQDSTQPLPVRFDLSSWDVKRLSLQDWLIVELSSRYKVPQGLCTQWVQAGLIFPLLDGLDEMQEASRPSCIEAINTYHNEHLRPLVVCSRTQEYTKVVRRKHLRLDLNSTVVVQPLSYEQVNAYLLTLGTPIAALHTALEKNETLQKLATTPLMLQVLSRTYQGTTQWEFPQKKQDLEQQIWRDYIQHMISEKGNAKHYPLDVTCAWLGWLARQMKARNQKIFTLEQLQPDWLPDKQKDMYEVYTWVAVRLIAGLLFGVPTAVLFALLNGIIVGFATGNIIGLPFIKVTKIEPAEALSWSWKDFRSGLRFLLQLGLFFAFVVELVTGLGLGRVWVAKPDILFVLLLFLVIRTGLFQGFSGKLLTKREELSPNEGIQQSMKNGFFLLGIDLGLGLLCGLTLLAREVSTGLLVGVGLALFSGLLYSRSHGLGAALQHYILRVCLWQSHSFPFNAVPFLEDAKTRILLQRDGGGYSFTHRLLLEYFADLDTTSPSPSTGLHQVPPTSQP